MAEAVADVLGADFSAQTLVLRPDEEGPVDATLIRRLPTGRNSRAVLYLHGFVDYFFHRHVAAQWMDRGFDFYALDLRKHGRSLRPHQTLSYVTDFAAYDEELDEAVRIIRDEGHSTVVVLAHSTGGLIAPLWADRRRGTGLIDALILNSPFFDHNGPVFERTVVTAIMDRVGRVLPKLVIRNLASNYSRLLHTENGGEWVFDPRWKPLTKFPVRAGWARAARRAHRWLRRGLRIDVPVLVLASARSGNGRILGPHHADSDCVLNVADMVIGASRLGPDVTVVRIEGGVHDLSLSRPAIREQFFAEVFGWVADHVPADHVPADHVLATGVPATRVPATRVPATRGQRDEVSS